MVSTLRSLILAMAIMVVSGASIPSFQERGQESADLNGFIGPGYKGFRRSEEPQARSGVNADLVGFIGTNYHGRSEENAARSGESADLAGFISYIHNGGRAEPESA